MLKFLRKKGNIKKIMWGLAILIIPAFVLWGAGSSVKSRRFPKYAGGIFDKRVSFRQYEASLLACRNQILLIYGEDFNRIAKYLNLEEEAWQRLILLYQAKKEKIKVSNQEVIQFIERVPLFQKEGRFNQDNYNALLGYAFHVDPRDFEEQVRGMLKVAKLGNKVTSSVSLTDEEIENVYKNENEKAEAFYALIELEEFKDQVHPSYEELEDYYQNHKSEFKESEQVNVQYIALYFDQVQPEINISEEEISNYYQEHIQQFVIEEAEGKQNTKPLEEVSTQIKEKLIQDKNRVLLEDEVWRLCDEIEDGPGSFEDAAKKNQLEVKETGFFGPQQVIPEIGLSYEFLNAAFTLEIGEVSNAIETPKGYFIIKLKEKRGPQVSPLDEIKEKVEAAVVKQGCWQLAKAGGEEILSQIKDMMQEKKLDFSNAVKELSLTIKETEEFTRASYVSGIGQSPEFTQAAFAMKPGELSDLIRVPNGYCILSLGNIIPIDKEKFTQEKEEFAKGLLARKKDVFYKIWLANLKKKANLINNLEKIKREQTP